LRRNRWRDLIETNCWRGQRAVGQRGPILGHFVAAVQLFEALQIEVLDLIGQVLAFGFAQLLPKRQHVLLVKGSQALL
jgi:hypothetical protein